MATVDVAQLMQAVAAARQRGATAEEARLLAEAVAQHPHDPLVLNADGARALAQGDWQLAARRFAAAAAADPLAPALWLNLAAAHRAGGEDAAEEAALARALAADQRLLMGQVRMAELLQRTDRPARAAEHWRRALALAAGAEDLPAALVARLEEARAFVAARDAAFAAFLDAELAPAMAGQPPMVARRFGAALDHAVGRRRLFTNECSGLHYPFLPADEFFDAAHFPWFAGLRAAAPAIRAEFEALAARTDTLMRPYVRLEPGTPDNKWSALDGRLDWAACFLWEYGAPNRPVLDACPATAAALEAAPRNRIPGRAPSAFFSILRPRTRIPPHTGVTNTRAIVHLPLIVPEGCGFRVGGETRSWVEGEPFAFDDTIEHEAWNDSDAVRVVLIMDVWNPHLTAAEQQLLVEYYAAADRSGHDPSK